MRGHREGASAEGSARRALDILRGGSPVAFTILMKFCAYCGVGALVINRDFSLLDDHRRRNHKKALRS